MSLKHKFLNYEFYFRDLTWREEAGLSDYLDILVKALTTINGQPVSPAEAARVFTTFTVPVKERLWTMYSAERPVDRTIEVRDMPWRPPTPQYRVPVVALEASTTEGEDV
jgi:hypothetical protein